MLTIPPTSPAPSSPAARTRRYRARSSWSAMPRRARPCRTSARGRDRGPRRALGDPVTLAYLGKVYDGFNSLAKGNQQSASGAAQLADGTHSSPAAPSSSTSAPSSCPTAWTRSPPVVRSGDGRGVRAYRRGPARRRHRRPAGAPRRLQRPGQAGLGYPHAGPGRGVCSPAGPASSQTGSGWRPAPGRGGWLPAPVGRGRPAGPRLRRGRGWAAFCADSRGRPSRPARSPRRRRWKGRRKGSRRCERGSPMAPRDRAWHRPRGGRVQGAERCERPAEQGRHGLLQGTASLSRGAAGLDRAASQLASGTRTTASAGTSSPRAAPRWPAAPATPTTAPSS